MNRRFIIFYYSIVAMFTLVLTWQALRFIGILLGYSNDGRAFLPYFIAPWLF